MIIEISALDTLFFRDGKPFSMGENHWTNSIFPPNMSTVYGAIRSAFFSENMDVFYYLKKEKKLNNKEDPTRKLCVKNMLYKINSGYNKGYYYNMPLDLVGLKDSFDKRTNTEENKRYTVYPLKLRRNIYLDSLPLKYILYFDEHVKTVADGLLPETMIDKYINGKIEKLEINRIWDYLKNESKIGIGLNKETGTSMDSRFYRIDLKRLQNISLIVEFDGIELRNKNGIFKLGGEGKYAKYEEISKGSCPFGLPKQVKINNRFKLCLLTPAIFEKGWIPKSINEEYILEDSKFKIKLVAAAVGKCMLVGGYDMVKSRPKPMLKAVPAGSTYYFEILEGEPGDIVESFHLKSVSDVMEEEGYGISFVSKWEV